MNKIYRGAAYVRLSKEDGDKIESDSIGNQKDLIRSYLREYPEIELCSEQVDDGYSGVDFQRPAFMAMLEDIKAKKIDCVIVKDFSRLGRNFIETGKYIQKIFPFIGVRFISVNDRYDSLNPKTSADNLIIPVKNLMNDAYCRDISIKIRSQLDIKRRKGDFIAPFAAFGYLKSEENKNKLIVDEFAAAVVRDIYAWKLEGMSAQAIAHKLNEQGALSPMEYKRFIGLNFSTPFKMNTKAKWTAAAVLRILKNPVYIGILEQGKRSSPNYKVKKRFDKPPDQWIRIENNHEPIIETEDFENVSKLLQADTRTAPKKDTVYPLSGLIYCADCGRSVIRKNNAYASQRYVYYVCSTYKRGNGCESHSIRDELLEKAVLESVRAQLNIIDTERILQKIEALPLTKREVKKADDRLTLKREELKKLNARKLRLHEDYADGLISKDDYILFKEQYEERAREAEAAILSIELEIDAIVSNKGPAPAWIDYFKQYKSIRELNRKLAVELIDRVTVYPGGKIYIQFKHQYYYDQLANLHPAMSAPLTEVM